MAWWQVGNQVVGNTAVEDKQVDRESVLRPFWDSLKEAGLKGEQVDVDAKLKEAGITDEKERNLSWDIYKASKQVAAIDNGASPTTYDSYGKELQKNTQAVTDKPTREYLEGIDKNLRSRVALNDQSATYAPTQKKSEGATSAEYDAMLNRFASGGELPKWEDVEKISNAQVSALEKKGVPKGNREAIRDVLNNAYAMRANADNPEKFAEYREKYLKALNYRGEDNEGKNKNKGLSWTVSRGELSQFRSTLDKIEGQQKSKETPKSDDALKDQVNDQIQKTRRETDQRRQGVKQTPKRTIQQRRTPQRKVVPQKTPPKGPVKPSIADLRRLDEQQIKAMEAEQEAKMLMGPSGVLFEWNEDKRRQKITDAEIRRREAQKRADEIKKQMGGN